MNDGDIHSPPIIWLLFGVVDEDDIGDGGVVLFPGTPPMEDDVIK
jgi:hypothetical protein